MPYGIMRNLHEGIILEWRYVMEEGIKLILEKLEHIDMRLDRIEERLDRLEERMDRLEERMDRLEERMDRLEERMDRLEEKVNGLEKRIDALEERVNGLEVRITALEEKVNGLEVRFNSLEKYVHGGFADLGMKITALQITVENEIRPNISIIAESHSILNRKLDIALKWENDREEIMLRTNAIESEIKVLQRRSKYGCVM